MKNTVRSPAAAAAKFVSEYPVPILFLIVSAAAIPFSGFSFSYLAQEIITRLGRNSFLVLALIIPIVAGMGLNFGMTLGAMAAQIALILVTDWNVVGLPGLFLMMILSVPLSVVFGFATGIILNRARGREMVTSFILAFFADGVYQLAVLYGMGSVIPISNNALVLSRGYGIRNTINLTGVRQVLDDLFAVRLFGLTFPVATYCFIALLCIVLVWFARTKLGHDMRAVGRSQEVADSSGIPVDRTRILAMVISTVLAGIGQLVYLQNMGTLTTYSSHTQIGTYSIAAILVGGATVMKARISNAFIGILLFHLLFVVSPNAGKNIIGTAQIGEYFRVFVSYGVIAVALVLHAWRHRKEVERERMSLRGGPGVPGSDGEAAV